MSDLENLRSGIDQIDNKILELLAERFSIVRQISEIKQEAGEPALDSDRWQQITSRLRAQADQAGLDGEDVVKIYDAIHRYVLHNIYRSKE